MPVGCVRRAIVGGRIEQLLHFLLADRREAEDVRRPARLTARNPSLQEPIVARQQVGQMLVGRSIRCGQLARGRGLPNPLFGDHDSNNSLV
jgi:hypothetical protein